MSNALDWGRIDTVLLDMDGTVLDLAFDNYFWLTHLPAAWGKPRGLAPDQAMQALMPHFIGLRGSLLWYCLDHWSELLEIDIVALKQECRDMIRFLPGAQDFLQQVRASGRRLLLVTNAHPDALALKQSQCPIHEYFEGLHSTHSWGRPKEDASFWTDFAQDCDVDLSRSLFVDDSEAVLRGAVAGGVSQVCGILAPDTSTPARQPFGDWPHVHGLGDISVSTR
ncbi:MAG: GMP/IMP nucleotidase [Oceanococcus sp.]|nr:MAG: GMP/IMP nucleotidase [Oceanococcus sp.]